jgi:hypothetical protein
MQDRRPIPRYSFEQPVALRAPGGTQYEARSCDISVAGMGLLAPHKVVVALAQAGSILTTGDSFQLALPGTLNDSALGGLTLDCRAKHVRRLSRDEYQVGVWFIEPTAAQTAALAALVQEARSSRLV